MIIAIMPLHILEAVVWGGRWGVAFRIRATISMCLEACSCSYCYQSGPTVALYDMSILFRLQGIDPKVEMQISSLSQRDSKQPLERKSYLACDYRRRWALQNEKSIFQQGHKEFNPYLSFFMSSYNPLSFWDLGLYKYVNVNFTCTCALPFSFLLPFYIKSQLFKCWFIHV